MTLYSRVWERWVVRFWVVCWVIKGGRARVLGRVAIGRAMRKSMRRERDAGIRIIEDEGRCQVNMG